MDHQRPRARALELLPGPEQIEALREDTAPRRRPQPLHHRFMEAMFSFVYRGDWPARLWGLWPRSARVVRAHHELKLLPEGSPRLRIAFLSDLHVGPTTHARTLDRAFEEAAAIQPDVLVLGGDYVYLGATDSRVRELEERIAAVPAPLKVGVLGNHDIWGEHDKIEGALRRAGVRLLANSAVTLPEPHDRIAILGLDDPKTGTPDAATAVRACGKAEVRIAVCHSPDAVPLLRGRGVSALLCGHTHGGQIAMPWGPLRIPCPYGWAFPFGMRESEGLNVFVSRGVGSVGLPMRTWAPPDVGVIDFV